MAGGIVGCHRSSIFGKYLRHENAGRPTHFIGKRGGSLKEDLAPLDIVLPDQFVDRTRGRISTFFGDGLVAHISFADPVCPDLIQQVHRASSRTGITVKKGGTYVCMEGPAFSTKAESNIYRSWGMDVIGMTNLQEAKLAREAEICYVTIALVTDYDCWYESP